MRVFLCLLALLAASAAAGESVDDVLEVQTDYQQRAVDSQSRLDALDDETLTLISRYNSEFARYEDLRTYNDNMRQLLASQAAEKARLEQELAEIEVVRRSVVPLMVEMVEVLERFIDLDQPMLKEERLARLAELKKNLTRSDVEIAERLPPRDRGLSDRSRLRSDHRGLRRAPDGGGSGAHRRLPESRQSGTVLPEPGPGIRRHLGCGQL